MLQRKSTILSALLAGDQEGNWLFPKVDSLTIRGFAADALQVLTRVVEARLNRTNVASIQSLAIRESVFPDEDKLLYRLYVGSLSLLVPNLVFLTPRECFNLTEYQCLG